MVRIEDSDLIKGTGAMSPHTVKSGGHFQLQVFLQRKERGIQPGGKRWDRVPLPQGDSGYWSHSWNVLFHRSGKWLSGIACWGRDSFTVWVTELCFPRDVQLLLFIFHGVSTLNAPVSSFWGAHDPLLLLRCMVPSWGCHHGTSRPTRGTWGVSMLTPILSLSGSPPWSTLTTPGQCR